MDSFHCISKQLFVVLVLCSWGTECTDTAGAINQDVGSSEDTSQSYFLYQQSEYPRDCQEVLRECSSSSSSGVYVIKPDGYPEPFEVYCDNDVSSSGWTVVQRRIDRLNFNRLWEDYKDGFGFLSSNYWLGNDKLSYLTNQAIYELRVDMELSNGSSIYVTYSGFRISDEWDNYSLLILGSFASGGDGSITSCPRTMAYGICTGRGTCEEPSGSSGSNGDCEFGSDGCVCPAGFLMDGDECVPLSECSCFWSEIDGVIPNGQSYVNDDCTERRSCTNNQFAHGEEYQCGANAQCTIRDGVRQCYCDEGYEGNGQSCEALPRDCYDVYNAGHRQEGVYTVMPTDWIGSPFNVSCVMNNGGGWTVFQRRSGSDRGTNFYRDWVNYRDGFGSFNGDFWLGNQKLHYLTRQRDYRLRVDIVTSGNSAKYEEYTSFETAAESDKYRLTVSGPSGSADDGMHYTSGEAFSTYDSDNDGCEVNNCAAKHRGGWWYSADWCTNGYDGAHCDQAISSGIHNTLCTRSNLNGEYTGGQGRNIFWSHSDYCNLNSVEMKIRPSI